MWKSELRKLFLERRTNLSVVDAAAMSQTLAERFFANVEIAAIKVLHCYLPIDKFNEPDTKLILGRVWTEYPSLTTTVPRIDLTTGELQSVVYSPSCPLIQNKWGLNEPEGGTVASPRDIDVAIVPLLCFDEKGFRVGYGKGYYDRFLAKCRPDCRKVGLSFFPPVEKFEDTNEHDVPLNLFITPEEIYQLEG